MNSIECTDRIINEASELFRVYGTKAVTMDTLAQHLGISKRTIYERFKDKDELLGAVLKCMMQKQKDLMEKMVSSEPNILIAMFKHSRIMNEHFGAMNPLLQSDLRKYHSEVIRELKGSCGNQFQNTLKFITIGIEQGVLRKDINPDIVNRCIQGMMRMASNAEIFPPEEFTQQDIAKNVFINFLRGIATPAGIKVIDDYEL